MDTYFCQNIYIKNKFEKKLGGLLGWMKESQARHGPTVWKIQICERENYAYPTSNANDSKEHSGRTPNPNYTTI